MQDHLDRIPQGTGVQLRCCRRGGRGRCGFRPGRFLLFLLFLFLLPNTTGPPRALPLERDVAVPTLGDQRIRELFPPDGGDHVFDDDGRFVPPGRTVLVVEGLIIMPLRIKVRGGYAGNGVEAGWRRRTT